ncbi:MAG: beta-ketoacyl-ACP synthase III [Lentisphaerae bacterium]|nr:beta-ketoacyl-ACP synthase III [Lentisphaerota bacterium]
MRGTVSDAFITDVAAFLPNKPVSNDTMAQILGEVSDESNRIRKLILRNNGIKLRYYALDPVSGVQTHTNAQMTAEAVRRLKPRQDFAPDQIELLCCGTASPDQLLPGHASMVQGELAAGKCEVVSTSGICVSGATSLKYAFASVAAGLSNNAVATGSELASTFMHTRNHEHRNDSTQKTLEENPELGFNAEFLRWMLSDGAGAVIIEKRPSEDKPSLRIDWIEQVSFANQLETCMYTGAVKTADGRLKGWREFGSLSEAVDNHCFSVQQDVRLLNKEVIAAVIDRALPEIIAKHELSPDEINWYLPHYSSKYFRQRVYDHMKGLGFEIPYERWFTNLTEKGNTGAGAMYIILDELYRSGKLRKDDRLLCFIPESGRFSVCYAHLTVV